MPEELRLPLVGSSGSDIPAEGAGEPNAVQQADDGGARNRLKRLMQGRREYLP